MKKLSTYLIDTSIMPLSHSSAELMVKNLEPGNMKKIKKIAKMDKKKGTTHSETFDR